MGQSDVYEYFGKHKTEWILTSKLALAFPEVSPGSLRENCKRLYKSGLLDRRKVHYTGLRTQYEYKYIKVGRIVV